MFCIGLLYLPDSFVALSPSCPIASLVFWPLCPILRPSLITSIFFLLFSPWFFLISSPFALQLCYRTGVLSYPDKNFKQMILLFRQNMVAVRIFYVNFSQKKKEEFLTKICYIWSPNEKKKCYSIFSIFRSSEDILPKFAFFVHFSFLKKMLKELKKYMVGQKSAESLFNAYSPYKKPQCWSEKSQFYPKNSNSLSEGELRDSPGIPTTINFLNRDFFQHNLKRFVRCVCW